MLIKPQSSCLGCKERVADPNCHTTCEKYLEFEKKNIAFREAKARNAEEIRIQNDIEQRRIQMAKNGKFYRSRRTKG